jgi:hypothetical protein
VGAAERDEFLRAAWRALVAGEIDAKRLVFVDEMGSNTALFSLYAWARIGERARYSAPRNRGKNTTLLASMSLEGRGACVWRWWEVRPRPSSRRTSSRPSRRPSVQGK